MNRSKLADLSEIVSSIAIVVTLVYLTIEIHQNTNALQAQIHQAVPAASQAELNMLVEHPGITVALASDGPIATEAEHAQIDAWFALVLRSREFSWLQFQDGSMSEAQWDTEVAVLVSIFDASVSRLWWDRIGRPAVGPDFGAFVDEILRANPPTDEGWRAIMTWSVPSPPEREQPLPAPSWSAP